MKAAVLYKANQPMVIEEMELLDPQQGEVLIRNVSTGVCHSDWHVIKGEWKRIPLPVILGHEIAGIVEAVGSSVTSLKAGDHVVLNWKPGCGRCETCQQGYLTVCDLNPLVSSSPRVRGSGIEINKIVGLGGFADYLLVPETTAVRISKDFPLSQAALLGCSVLTGVGAVINTARVRLGASVAVFGCGGVGLNVIQGARMAKAGMIVAVDLLEQKLDLAKEFGATHTVNASREDPVARIKEWTAGLGTHYAFEAIGMASQTYVQSVECTRRRGVTIWVGAAPDHLNVTLSATALAWEKTIMGSNLGSSRPHIDIPNLLDCYKAGDLKLDELITHTFQLEEINSAFNLLSTGDVARAMISFS